jgi:hypothetical protein
MTTASPQFLVVDIYGDGDSLRVLDNTPEIRRLIEAWRKLDDEYCRQPIALRIANPTNWMPFTDYLEAAGITPYAIDIISL